MEDNNTINLDNYSINEEEYKELCNKYSIERVNEELELEVTTQENSYTKFINRLNKSKINERGKVLHQIEGTTASVVSEAVPVLAKAIKAFFDEADTGKPGKRHTIVSILNRQDGDDKFLDMAYLTTKVIMASLIRGSGANVILLSKLSQLVGKSIEEQYRFTTVLKSFTSKRDRDMIQSQAKTRVGELYLKAFWKAKERSQIANGKLTKWKSWSETQILSVGMKLVELFVSSTGLGQITKFRKERNAKELIYHFSLTPEIIRYIDFNDERLAQFAFEYHPMIIPPKEWKSSFGGGYFLNLKREVPFIKSTSKRDLLNYAEIDMPNVYKAVNTIQNTKWRINQKVLSVANAVCNWDVIPEALDMSSMYPAEKPYRDPECDTNEEMQLNWRRKMLAYYQKENRRKSRRLLVNALLSEANQYSKYEEIYFPWNIDFRGRMYPLTRFSPQGNDFNKGLLEFAEGKPIGNVGKTWLAFHGANCYGLDKKPLQERLEWVYSNPELIVSIANDPLTDTRWMETDSPWEFLAFCFEWEGVLNEGEAYVSHLPVAFDGSCSGLQHYSAMLRDEIGGEAVNLTPENQVQDIYKRVADKVIEYLKVDVNSDTVDEIKVDEEGNEYLVKSISSLAREWLDYGITRKVTKRSTMTLCYGARKYGFADQIMDDTIIPALSHNPTAFSRPGQSSRYLAGLIWQALGEVVVKAKEAMDWLQEASALLAKDRDANGKPLPTYWITPAGFPVTQKYSKTRLKQVDVILTSPIKILDPFGHVDKELKKGDEIHPSVEAKIPDELDPRKQRNGIAPNFVHSMDASHMMLTVDACVDKGIHSFACIHDSFGTHACDAQVLFETIRDVFIKTYEENDVLQDFHDHVANLLSKKNADDLPDIPTKGKLNLEGVRQSIYAFS